MTDETLKRDVTRRRIIEAANARFGSLGYEQTTAAIIADDAGVTERTFFRYFPTKAAVLVANWEGHVACVRDALAQSNKNKIVDVVRDALVTFTDRLQAELDSGLDSVILLYVDRAAFVAITQMLLDIETDVAAEIAKRASRPIDDLDVRVAANTAFGVFRAAVRAYVTDPSNEPMSNMVSTHMRKLGTIFKALEGNGA
jgi:AcrR family transcriptional regulator